MAQLVARLVRNEKVRGSNPLSSTTKVALTREGRDPRSLDFLEIGAYATEMQRL